MIQTRDLTKSFGANRAVEDVTVTFPAGTVTALLGLNGAGKTTLLSLLAGLITAGVDHLLSLAWLTEHGGGAGSLLRLAILTAILLLL